MRYHAIIIHMSHAKTNKKITFYILMGLSFLGLDADVTLLLFVLDITTLESTLSWVRGLHETPEVFLPPRSRNI